MSLSSLVSKIVRSLQITLLCCFQREELVLSGNKRNQFGHFWNSGNGSYEDLIQFQIRPHRSYSTRGNFPGAAQQQKWA